MDNRHSPFLPKLLSVLLPDDLHHLIGDLEEEYHENVTERGKFKGRFRFWYQVSRSAPYFISQSLIWNFVMLFNYLKITWRNILKHKSFSLINILGLAVSLALCLLIMLFIIDQRSYDRFHEHADRIYRVNSNFKSQDSNTLSLYGTTPADLAELLDRNYSLVEEAVHIRDGYSGEIRVDEKTFNLQGLYTDGDFFRIFDFELLQGNPQTALSEPGNIILTPESAYRLFGNKNAIGKTITELGDRDYTVTGIINNDVKTHFRFEALVSISSITAKPEMTGRPGGWKNGLDDSYTFVLLKEQATAEDLAARFPGLIAGRYQYPDGESGIRSFELQPLTKINLGPDISNQIGVILPGIIAWFLIGFGFIVILIASFNYVSLTVARALNRGKEVGVRKVLGAFRGNVIRQFLTESVIIAVLALVFAIFLLQWMLPHFNSLALINVTENQIGLSLINDYRIYIAFLIFSVFVGILAGIYPSVYLSSFQPARVLKGTTAVKGLSATTLRKMIVVIQFTLSIVFIITVIILYKQFIFMLNVDHGFNSEYVINVELQDIPYQRFEDKYSSYSDLVSIAASSKVPALGLVNRTWMKTDSVAERIRGHYFDVNEKYIQTMGLNLLAGRNFNPDIGSDSTENVILSKSAVVELSLVSPAEAIGKPVEINEDSYTIIGIIDDFISENLISSGNPILLRLNPQNFNYAVVKVRPGETAAFANYLEHTWLELESIHSLKYQIFDEQLEETAMVLIFDDFLKVTGVVAVLSILISCLGLLGMAMYSAENRIKEIGIRKIMGATVQNIVILLSKEYLILIGIAVAIGTPLAWVINNLWLQEVTNKISIGPWVFVIGILGTTLLALLTIGSQTIRAARANSVDNLSRE